MNAAMNNIHCPCPINQARRLHWLLNNNIYRPNYSAGVELDGPYRPTPAHRAKRLRELLARLLNWIKP